MSIVRHTPWVAFLALSLAGCDFSSLLKLPASTSNPTGSIPTAAPTVAPANTANDPVVLASNLKQAAGFASNLKQAAGLGAVINGPTAALKQAAGLDSRLSGYRISSVTSTSDSNAITFTGTFETADGSLAATGSVVGTPADLPTAFDLDLTVATASAAQLAQFRGARIRGFLDFELSSAPGLKSRRATPLIISMATESYTVDFQYLIVTSTAGPRFRLTTQMADPNKATGSVYVGWDIGGDSPNGWVSTDRDGVNVLGSCRMINNQWLAYPVGTASATASVVLPF